MSEGITHRLKFRPLSFYHFYHIIVHVNYWAFTFHINHNSYMHFTEFLEQLAYM